MPIAPQRQPCAANPRQPQPAERKPQRREQVESAVPAMDRRPAGPDRGDKLDQSAERDDRRHQHMDGEEQVARGVARDMAGDQRLVVPRREIAGQRRRVIKEQDEGDEE